MGVLKQDIQKMKSWVLKLIRIERVNNIMRTLNKKRYISLLLTLLLAGMMAANTMSMAAQPTVSLGITSGFAVLAGSTITNIGPITISGNAGGNVEQYSGSAFIGESVTLKSHSIYMKLPKLFHMNLMNDNSI